MFTDAAYLDAIFTEIRTFTAELTASKGWLARAEQTQNQAWRLTFLMEARAAFGRVAPHFVAAMARLSELGPVESLPAPLNQIHKNLESMKADLASLEESLRKAEDREAGKALGQA